MTTKSNIQAVLSTYPRLCYAGLSNHENSSLAEQRERLCCAVDEVDRARVMLRHPDNLAFFAGRAVNSYHLKHLAESRHGTHLGYVSNGALIVAAVLEGFTIPEWSTTSAVLVRFPGTRRRRKRGDHTWQESERGLSPAACRVA